MSSRIFATADIGPALDILRRRGYQVEVYDKIEPPPKGLILEKVRSGIDALITTLRDKIDQEVFAAGAATLKVVAQIAVGFDNIDREAANKYKIPFTNTADVLTEATAEFAFFIMAAASRRLWSAERLVRESRWRTWHPYDPFLGDEVTGKTVSVIGTGRIGKAFIKKCVGLDVNILCYDPLVEDREFAEKIDRELELRYASGLWPERRAIRYTTFEEALREGDYVSLHVPLLMPGQSNLPTYHMMDDRAFSLMKPSAYLINTSRGPVVDELALYRALKEGKIRGAALDVYESEPLPAESPLRDPELEDKVRLLPHFASATHETRLSPDPNRGMAGRCVQAVLDVLERNYGGNPALMPYVVNKEAFQ